MSLQSNDKCSPFSDGTVDVALKDRRKDYYINVTFCGDECSYGGINYTSGKVIRAFVIGFHSIDGTTSQINNNNVR